MISAHTFSWRTSVDGRPNRRKKLSFEISPANRSVSGLRGYWGVSSSEIENVKAHLHSR